MSDLLDKFDWLDGPRDLLYGLLHRRRVPKLRDVQIGRRILLENGKWGTVVSVGPEGYFVRED